MSDAVILVLSCVAGSGLGAAYFGGLWWTVRRGTASPRPARWFVGSLILRMSLTLLGFYLVAGGHGERLLACLVGFVLARQAVTWLTRTPGPAIAPTAPEGSHAP